ncbi:histidine kinase [Flammeovirga yaeyamensis]|uniref:Histidine kinase n=1 Tax=Flammeovirga yaeyamensis TaxID=367791 RepID=A0AAX1N101_9BACT|nr:histidine kinase [Flammeovirga yaeyamensis]MBB3698599.1 hypothetical protein [Flammeovirga yaeyamensis]NMF34053.1 histidine kinase [Flammeovirga yaeyamensis]QWG01041.1 histidine kinase [Flammeovirga yaeyamensis]
MKNKFAFQFSQTQLWQTLVIVAYFALTFNFFSERFGVWYAFLKALLLIGAQIFIWFINVKYLVPKLLIKKKHGLYAIVLLFLVISSSFTYIEVEKFIFNKWKQKTIATMHFPFDETEIPPTQDEHLNPQKPPQDIRQKIRHKELREDRKIPKRVRRGFKIFESLYNLILFGVVALASTSYRMTVYSLKKESEASKLREENVKSEMSFLKSQVNPHFLFNVLNNIYSLSFVKSDKTPEVVLQLSDLLRYMLYDTTTDTVPITKEVEYLNNFIGLHLLKSDNIKDNVDIDIQVDHQNVRVAPLLFAPFIENAFKHSHIENHLEGWIKLSLKVDDEGEIHFKLSNSIPKKTISKDKQGGIGLENVKKRLNLQYKHQHTLNIEKQLDAFHVELHITTHKNN